MTPYYRIEINDDNSGPLLYHYHENPYLFASHSYSYWPIEMLKSWTLGMFQYTWIINTLCTNKVTKCFTSIFRTCSINDQCQSIPINAGSKFCYWSKMWLNKDQCQSIDRYWFSFIDIDIYWSALVSMPQIWSGIDHWSSMSCILEGQSGKVFCNKSGSSF